MCVWEGEGGGGSEGVMGKDADAGAKYNEEVRKEEEGKSGYTIHKVISFSYTPHRRTSSFHHYYSCHHHTSSQLTNHSHHRNYL